MAELVDAPDSKSGVPRTCRFESDHPHHRLFIGSKPAEREPFPRQSCAAGAKKLCQNTKIHIACSFEACSKLDVFKFALVGMLHPMERVMATVAYTMV